MKYRYIYIILIYNFIQIFSLSTKDNKFVKISLTEENLVPTINAQLKNKNFSIILNNNLGHNYISTKNFNLTDFEFNFDSDKIRIKDKIYEAYFYIGPISIFNGNNYMRLADFNSYVIDDKIISSSITIFYLLLELLIDKKDFYLDINNKNYYLGDIPFQSKLYSDIYNNDKFNSMTFYSNETIGVFKQKLKNLYIGNNALLINKFASFTINDYITIFPLSILKNIIRNKYIQELDCNLILLDRRGIYAIKCNKDNINKLPNLYFVFNNNYTFNISFDLLFEDFDDNYKISLIRNKIKYNTLRQNDDDNNNDNEEIIIGYSIIKLFNYTIFSYDKWNVSFFSDKFIISHPPRFLSKYIYFLLYFLLFLLLFTTPCLIYIKLKLKKYLAKKYIIR